MTFRLRIITSVCCGIIVLILCSMTAAAAGVLLGDADSDGAVTTVDATCIQRKLAGLHINGSLSKAAADVDGNGLVEITDAAFIQRWTAEIKTPYPIGVQPTEAPTQQSTDDDGWGHEIFRP